MQNALLMSADDCIFCKMVAGQIPVTKIYEDEVVLSFLDIGPISDGHTLVIPKQHFEKLHECPAELLGRVFTRIGRIAGAVACAMNSDGYNFLCNNVGQLVSLSSIYIFILCPEKQLTGYSIAGLLSNMMMEK